MSDKAYHYYKQAVADILRDQVELFRDETGHGCYHLQSLGSYRLDNLTVLKTWFYGAVVSRLGHEPERGELAKLLANYVYLVSRLFELPEESSRATMAVISKGFKPLDDAIGGPDRRCVRDGVEMK